MTTPPGAGGELAGLRFAPDPTVEVRSGGRVLLGGSPLRVVRLTDAGAEVARQALDGEPVPPGRGPSALVRRLLDGGLVHPVPSTGPFGADAVTVVIPVRGEVPPDLLAGLGPVAAVVVVDDASPVPVTVPDRTPTGAPVTVVRRPERGGPAAARNTGLAAVGTELVAFVDADCVPRPGWLDGLLPHLADPRVAVVAPRIVPVALDSGAGVLARYEATRSALDLGPRPARVRARSRVSFVPSAALLARVEVLRGVGGFDADMAVGEDVDLV
ncbi:MAG TPA: glycosyltransferase, partial [Phycicoccus sp.]|nr:glycosyltransferase [Phycicoccus sp.]